MVIMPQLATHLDLGQDLVGLALANQIPDRGCGDHELVGQNPSVAAGLRYQLLG